jgi:LysM repeat protein
MTRQQALFVIVVNAIISAIISSVVVMVAFAFYAPAPSAPQYIVVLPTASLAPPTPTRRTTPISYVVQPGDTLSLIAAKFNISMAALMQANGLTNPNVLKVGDTLIVPPLDFTPTPVMNTVAPTPVPILKIVSIVRAASAQAATGETVIIQNIGPRVNLKGWSLVDLQGNLYAFPDFVFESNSVVRVHTESGLDTATDLYWGREKPMWDANDTATLKDRTGNVMDRYTVQR